MAAAAVFILTGTPPLYAVVSALASIGLVALVQLVLWGKP